MENDDIKLNTSPIPPAANEPLAEPAPATAQAEPPAEEKIEAINQPTEPEPATPPTETEEKKIEAETEIPAEPTSPTSETNEEIIAEDLPKKEAEVTPTPPSASAPAPTPPVTESAAPAQPTDTFPTRFKAKLKELLAIANIKRQKQVDEHAQKIMDYALKHNRIDNKDAREVTGLKDEQARYYLNKLEKEKKLEQMGVKGPRVFYMPIRKQ
ncbi:MAG: FaeA/PapI family transcriptional regulator [Patescibacteria group bacterium]